MQLLFVITIASCLENWELVVAVTYNESWRLVDVYLFIAMPTCGASGGYHYTKRNAQWVSKN